jgi:hypothetical protein
LKQTIYILILFVFGTSLTTYGQSDLTDCSSTIDTLTGGEVYSFVDKMPTPEGGELKLFEEMKKLKYSTCMTLDSQILVAFIVDTSGHVIGKRIIKDIAGTDLSDQVLTLIDNVNWIIGTCKGIPVPVMYRLPVRVCLK